jgi:hypothetical protein
VEVQVHVRYQDKGKITQVRPRTRHEGQEGEQRYSSTLSLTSALNGGGWLTPRPNRFTPGEETRYPLCRRRGGSQGRCERVHKISPLPGFDPRTVPGQRIINMDVRKQRACQSMDCCIYRARRHTRARLLQEWGQGRAKIGAGRASAQDRHKRCHSASNVSTTHKQPLVCRL